MQRQEWFPAKDSPAVVGRIVEIEKPHTGLSKEAGEQVYVLVPAMEHKVLKDSSDTSFQEIKPHTKDKLLARFPGAWEAYMAKKQAEAKAPIAEEIPKATVLPTVKGRPIDEAIAFMPKGKVGHLKMIGFATVEQLAEMSDEQMGSLGPGARNWRKKAQQLLKG
jgi:hypothetical protein